jgi:hypothetical protein
MAETFLIGDDGSATWDSTEITSAQSVTFNKERPEIESRARGSDNVAHRAGKLKSTCSVDVRVEPNDAGLAALLSSIDNNSEAALVVTREEGDEIENANYVALSCNEEQPLEEGQTASIELAFHSGISS